MHALEKRDPFFWNRFWTAAFLAFLIRFSRLLPVPWAQTLADANWIVFPALVLLAWWAIGWSMPH